MKERAAMIGGEIQISSAPGRGTKVLISVPVSES
jgi:signal transduction histidine kinase